MSNITITGGTGTLGSEIVKQFLEQKQEVSILTTKEKKDIQGNVNIIKGDLTEKNSLEPAFRDAEIVVHCASNPINPQAVDIEGTRNLLAAVNPDRLKHIIYVSIVGVNRSDYPYYVAKYEAEKLILASGFPSTILRATQFHNLVLRRLIEPADQTGDPVIRVPADMRFQSIDIKDISNKIVDLVLNDPTNAILTAGGPEISTLEEMTEVYLDFLGENKQIVPDPDDTSFPSFKSGINLCPEHAYGKITWKAFLMNSFKRNSK